MEKVRTVIEVFERQYRLAQKRMNDRYDEFEDGLDCDYPEGPIGDPESLVNEAVLRTWGKAIRLFEEINQGAYDALEFE